MSEKVKPSQLLDSIELPPQEITRLRFCGSSKSNAVREWVDNLQATKIMLTSGKLYNAIPEIPRLKTHYQNRFEILEIVRPSVQYAILGLQKAFLNQPLIMPEPAQKAALVAQSLQKNMIDGYIATIVQIAQKGKAKQQTLDLLTTTIHRAITGVGLLFFRNYQIYAQTPIKLWATIHKLYQVADYYNLTDTAVVDQTLQDTRALSIEATYARVLMLASAKTNQLSQTDIEAAFTAFENWCQSVKLHKGLTEDLENFYAVNLDNSQGPIYKSKIKALSGERYLEMDVQALLSQLSKQSTSSDTVMNTGVSIKVPKDFSSSLLQHLTTTWGNVAQRKYERRSVEATAEVCVGLLDSHYFICNGQDFDLFLRSAGTEEGHHISRFSQGLAPTPHTDEYQNSHIPIYNVTVQNISAGGYCILWQFDISSKVSAGEVMAVKESGKRTWSLGVIRWVRQLKMASQLGVQLLSHNAKPYGIAQASEMGGSSEYMRALFLPPTKFGHGSPTLLTASAPFQEFDRVRVVDGEREWLAKLESLVFSTKNIQQFSLRNLEMGGDQKTTSSKPAQNFDSSWE